MLDMLITMLSEHCVVPFEAETTQVIYEETGLKKYFPTLGYREEEISVKTANEIVGIK